MAVWDFAVLRRDLAGGTGGAGKVCACKESPASWSDAEQEPYFAHVLVEGSPEAAHAILRQCRYDFEASQFVDLLDGLPFDSRTDLLRPLESTEDLVHINERVAKALGLDKSGDAAKDLCPPHQAKLTMIEWRSYWRKALWNCRKMDSEAARSLPSIAIYGCFGQFIEVLQSLTKKQQKEVYDSLPTDDDRAWLKNYLKVVK